MIIFDTDHVSELQRRDSQQAIKILSRLAQQTDRRVAVTIATIEEQLRGRLAVINQSAAGTAQILPYTRLIELLEFYSDWTMLPFDQIAAQHYLQLKKTKLRIGTMDLKIASIVLAQKGTLLTANLRDFRKIPSLPLENWLSDE